MRTVSQTQGKASQTPGKASQTPSKASQTSGKGLLFDIDGTLADTDPLHLAAFNQVLGPHGHAFDHARFGKELQGFSNASIGERFLAHELPERRAIILGEKERVFRELVSGQIAPVPD